MYLVIDQDAVIRSACDLPALPPSAAQLAAIMSNDDIQPEDVVKVIECDPAMTLKLLRVANSVYSSSKTRIGTVRESVIRLGIGTVLGLGLGSSIRPNFGKVIPGYSFAATDFWQHSLTAALIAECISQCSRLRLSPTSFTAALLHDIGKIVLGEYLDATTISLLEQAQVEGRQDAFCAECELLSLNHAEVGALIAQHWKLPDTIVKGILYHHTPELSDEPIAYVIHLANSITEEVSPTTEFNANGLRQQHRPDLSADYKYLGISEASKPRILDTVRDRLGALAANLA